MPGAPNKPPEGGETTSTRPTEDREVILRRLIPSYVALHHELFRGSPPKDLTTLLEQAEKALEAGEFRSAMGFLDRFSVRLAEPRWPTLPEPFRSLRVEIPLPQPPHWDPEHSLSPTEKEEKTRRKKAEVQLSLVTASLDLEERRGIPLQDLREFGERARATFLAGGATGDFWQLIDRLWMGLRERIGPRRDSLPSGAT